MIIYPKFYLQNSLDFLRLMVRIKFISTEKQCLNSVLRSWAERAKNYYYQKGESFVFEFFQLLLCSQMCKVEKATISSYMALNSYSGKYKTEKSILTVLKTEFKID